MAKHPSSLLTIRSSGTLRFKPSEICSMRQSDLHKIQIGLGFGNEWGLLEVPEKCMPPGQLRIRSRRTCSIRSIASEGISIESDEAQAAWAHVVRLAILRAVVPSGRNGCIPGAGTFFCFLSFVTRIARQALLKRGDNDVFWGRLTDQDAKAILGRAWVRHVAPALNSFVAQGLIHDSIVLTGDAKAVAAESNRKGSPALSSPQKRANQWQPLPDEFVAEIGWRILWLVEKVGPSLLTLLQVLLDAGVRSASHTSHWNDYETRQRLIENWNWKAPDNSPIAEIPFDLFLPSRRGLERGRRGYSAWPPKNFEAIRSLLSHLQSCHAWLISLAAGPRQSEVLGLEEDCLMGEDGCWRISGRTYKEASSDDGDYFDFPLPSAAAQACRQQKRLARLVKTYKGDESDRNLWVALGGRRTSATSSANDLNQPLKNLVRSLNVGHLLGTQHSSMHPHRLRYTLARLIGLALVNGRMILMDLFGHQDPETTIGYMTSNQRMHAETLETIKGLVVLMATEAIGNAETNGGPAAEAIKRAVSAKAKILGKDSLEPKDVYELANQLTFQGRYWTYARPGVICTKPPGSFGPCNKAISSADPANCQTHCIHRLEEAQYRAETDETIRDIVQHLEHAIEEEETLLAEHWRGQLRAHVTRFDDIHERWKSHPLVSLTFSAHEKTSS